MNLSIRLGRVLLLVLTVLLLGTLVHADSVVWSTPIPDLIAIGSDGADRATVSMFNVAATVQYHATPWLVDVSGNKIRALQSGDHLLIGDKVLFEFPTQTREDISWFGEGGAYDTPYGTWFDGIVPENISNTAFASTLIYEWISNTIAQGKYGLTESGRKGGNDANHVALSISKPSKQVVVSGAGPNCSPTSNNSQICTFTTAGTITEQFNFAQTTGEFFAAWTGNNETKLRKAPDAMTLRADLRKSAGDFDLIVPAQNLPFTFIVTDATENPPINHTPTPPTLAAAAGTGACVVGIPYTITMSATDPQNDTVRYGIDWDADGAVDQYVPLSGYVPSGTMQSASRTYSTAGTKTLKVFAENSHGSRSSWAALLFTCTDSSTNSTNSGFNGNNNTNNNNNNNGGGGSSIIATLNLRVIPSLVHKGDTTKVNWSATNVTSCTVNAPNGDTWNATQSVIGGETSSPIMQATMYTLSCLDLNGATLTKTATVRILPSFQEK